MRVSHISSFPRLATTINSACHAFAVAIRWTCRVVLCFSSSRSTTSNFTQRSSSLLDAQALRLGNQRLQSTRRVFFFSLFESLRSAISNCTPSHVSCLFFFYIEASKLRNQRLEALSSRSRRSAISNCNQFSVSCLRFSHLEALGLRNQLSNSPLRSPVVEDSLA
jgi:hypothetical protein